MSSDWLKSHDMFGHTVNFSFNGKGDTHNTAPGGFFSVIIKLAVAVYVFLKLKILILSEGDNNSSALFLVDNSEGGSTHVDYSETQVILSPVLQKIKYGIEEVEYDEETQKFIEIRFVERHKDIDEHEETVSPFPAKFCTEDDFSLSETTLEIFNMNKL